MQVGSRFAASIILLLTTLVLFGNSQRLKKDDEGLFGLKKRLRSLQTKGDGVEGDCCENIDGRPSSVTMEYTGGECEAENVPVGNPNPKSECENNDFEAGTETVTITIEDEDAKIESNSGSGVISADGFTITGVKIGEEITIVPLEGEDFKSSTKMTIEEQELTLHTSCSAPLIVAEVFGALTLRNVVGVDEDETEVSCAVCVPSETVPNEGCDDEKPNCYEGECVGCVNTGTGDEADMFCPGPSDDSDQTQCDAPQDEAGCDCFCCVDDATGDGQDSGCPTSTPLCKAKNQGEGVNKDDDEDSCCAVCVNNMPGSFPDTGCNETTPVCIDTDEPLEPLDPFDFGDECAVCDDDMPGDHQDSGCPKDLPLCEVGEIRQCRACINNKRGGLRDSGCPEHCTICVADEDTFGDECRVCQNDKVGGGQDSGCPATKKLCITDNNDVLGGYGDECALCANDFDFANSIPDSGCDDPDRPVCCAGKDMFGFECVTCKNDRLNEMVNGDVRARMLDGHVDTGCSPNAPFCDGVFSPDECQASKGSGCFVCKRIGDYDNDMFDPGCDDAAPVCVAPLNNYGLQCAVCINNADVDGTDTGCSDKHPVCDALPHKGGHQCGTCRNDMPGDETDSGCTDDLPLCGADFGELGSKCFKCSNDCPDDHQDTGCPADKPICATDEHGDFAKECALCQNTQPDDIPGDLNCDGFCGSGDDQEGRDDLGEGGYGCQCYECKDTEDNENGMPLRRTNEENGLNGKRIDDGNGGRRRTGESDAGCSASCSPQCQRRNGEALGESANLGFCPDDIEVTVELTTDDFGNEVSWTLTNTNTNEGVAELIQGAQPSDTTETYGPFCVPDGDCYDFTINDSFGDGICCDFGLGTYEVDFGGEIVPSPTGGDYGSGETVTGPSENCPAGAGVQELVEAAELDPEEYEITFIKVAPDQYTSDSPIAFFKEDGTVLKEWDDPNNTSLPFFIKEALDTLDDGVYAFSGTRKENGAVRVGYILLNRGG